MKKLMMMAVILLASVGSVMAQSDYKRGIFNHVGLNVGAGTEGISVGVAAPVTNFLEVEAGVNIMPSFKLSGDLDVDVNTDDLPPVPVPNVQYPSSATIHAEGSFDRTTFNVKANLYPFGGGSKFFIAAGLSIGGEKIAEVTGSCDKLRDFSNNYLKIIKLWSNSSVRPYQPTWVVTTWSSMRIITFRVISVARMFVHTSV